jgi:hypothetical protein
MLYLNFLLYLKKEFLNTYSSKYSFTQRILQIQKIKEIENNSNELRIPKYLCFLLENDKILYLFVIILILVVITFLYITTFSIYLDQQGSNLFKHITKKIQTN